MDDVAVRCTCEINSFILGWLQILFVVIPLYAKQNIVLVSLLKQVASKKIDHGMTHARLLCLFLRLSMSFLSNGNDDSCVQTCDAMVMI